MTTQSHAVRLTREQNYTVRREALVDEVSKEQFLATKINEIAERAVTDEPDWVVTKVSVTDEVWSKVQAIAKARGITVSALVAEHAA